MKKIIIVAGLIILVILITFCIYYFKDVFYVPDKGGMTYFENK